MNYRVIKLVFVLLTLTYYVNGDHEILNIYSGGQIQKYFSNLTKSYEITSGYPLKGGCVESSTNKVFVFTMTSVFKAPRTGLTLFAAGSQAATDCAATPNYLFVLNSIGSPILQQFFISNGTVAKSEVITNGPLYNNGSLTRSLLIMWRQNFYIASDSTIYQYTLNGTYVSTISLPLPSSIVGLAFSYISTKAFISTSSNNNVFVYNPYTWASLGNINGPSSPASLATAPNGNIFIASGSGAYKLDEQGALSTYVATPPSTPIVVKTNLDDSACSGGCGANGYCNYNCSCYPGWESANCNNDTDECENAICPDYWTSCVNIPGSYRCDCSAGAKLNASGICEPCPSGFTSNVTNAATCNICPEGTYSESHPELYLYGVLSNLVLTDSNVFGPSKVQCGDIFGSAASITGNTHGFKWVDTATPVSVVEISFAKRWNCNGNSRSAYLNDQNYWSFSFPSECSGCSSPTTTYLTASIQPSIYYSDGVTQNTFAIQSGPNFEGLEYLSPGIMANVTTYGWKTWAAVVPSSCILCQPGSIAPTPGSKTCEACGQGTYSSNYGSTNCTACPLGSANAASGAANCTECIAGSFANTTGMISCDQCPAGTYSKKGSSTCTPCPPGFYSSAGSGSCSPCGLGYYSDVYGATTCKWCPPGSFSSASNSSSCTPCAAGTFSNSNGTITCSTCANGTFSPQNSTFCSDCAPGTYYDLSISTTACLPCPAGSFSNTTKSTNCTICPAGTFSSLNAIGCTDCLPGTFSAKNSSACTPCLAGSYSNTSRASSCINCTAGTFNNDTGLTYCTNCAPGTYQNTSGSAVCYTCGAGTYAPGASTSCFKCNVGYENPYVGQSACTPCNSTSFSNKTGSAYCDLCPPSSYSTTSYDIVGYTAVKTIYLSAAKTFGFKTISCGIASNTSSPFGFYIDKPNATVDRITVNLNLLYTCGGETVKSIKLNNKTVQTFSYPSSNCYEEGVCPIGTSVITFDFVTTTSSLQTVNTLDISSSYLEVYDTMLSGAYADVTFYAANKIVSGEPVLCDKCEPGLFGNSSGGGCSECPAGTFSNSSGSTYCSICPPGYFSAERATNCTPCAVGTASDAWGTPYFCPACPFSYFMNRTGATECEPCPEGFTDRIDKVHCTPCPTGTYSNQTASVCVPCDYGHFANKTASTSCELCVPGTTAASMQQTNCDYCIPGTYNNEYGSLTCEKCIKGTYANSSGSTTCLPCQEGTANNDEGQPTCPPCSQGYYSNTTGAYACSACNIGTYANVTGSRECSPCPEGAYSNSPATKTCTTCNYGEYGNTTGATSCYKCPAGTYGSIRGLTSCFQCKPGFTTIAGSANCSACALGSYRGSKEEAECTACPENSSTKIFAAVSKSSCICSEGYYGPDGGPCAVCSDGGYCPGGNVIEPAPGYYRSEKEENLFLTCASTEACPGYTDGCGEGYAGRLCGQCDTNYYHLSGKCKKCPNNSAWYILLFGIIALVISLILLRIGGTLMKGAPIMFIFNLVQISALFGNFRLSWPKELKYVFDLFSSINFNIDLFSPECAASFSYYDRWLVTLFLPAFMLLFLTAIWLMLWLAQTLTNQIPKYDLSTYNHTDPTVRRYNVSFRERLGNRTLTFNMFVNAVFLMLNISYTFVNSNLFELFSCQKQVDGSYTLLAAPQYECFDTKWYSMLTAAVISFVVYTIGIPLTYFIILYKNRDKIEKRDLDFGDRYGVLFVVYHRGFYFWEVTTFGRKLGIVIAKALVMPLSQCILGICVLFAALQLQAFWKPFSYSLNNKLEYLSILVPLVVLFTGLLFYSQKLPNEAAAHIISGFVIVFVSIAVLLLVVTIYHHLIFIFYEKFKEKSLNTAEKRNEQLITYIWHKHAPYVLKTFKTMEIEQQAEFIKYCHVLVEQISANNQNEMSMVTFTH